VLSGQFSLLTALFPLRDPPAPHSVTLPLLTPLPCHGFLARPLTAALPLTQYSAHTAPFSAPIALCSHAVVTVYTNQGKIWCRTACHRFTVVCQISPRSVKGMVWLSCRFCS